MTAPADTVAKLLHDARFKRRAACEARAVNDDAADHKLRQQAFELEQKAEALDPQHQSEAWILET